MEFIWARRETATRYYGNHIFKSIGSGINISNGYAIADPINYSPTDETDIYDNRIENHTNCGIGLSEGHMRTKVHRNDISDCNINLRLHKMDQSGETNRSGYVYRNRFWLPTGVGSHFYFHFYNVSPDTYHPVHWIYNNSFSGGDFGLMVSGYAYGSGGLPNVIVKIKPDYR